jgi:hypothetical protein
MLYLFIFFIVVGIIDYCTNNGIELFFLVDILVKSFIVLSFISCLVFTVDGDFELMILCMLIFVYNYLKGRRFYEELEENLKEVE